MVPCSYERGAEDLKLVREHINVDLGFPRKACSSSRLTIPAKQPLRYTSAELLTNDPNHEVILRFQRRTVLTLGTEQTSYVHAQVIPRLAMQHEYLLHAVLAITTLHDRALAGTSRSTTAESYHLSYAASLFNQKLSRTIADEDRDALWVTAVYLCVMAVFNIDTYDPDDAWPLRPYHPTDLDWLKMQAGLRVIWNLAQVDRGDGMVAYVERSSKSNCVYPDHPKSGIVGMPQTLVDLCGLTNESEASNNPYHTAARHLSYLLPIEGSPANLLVFMVFAGGITKDFKTLLGEKDPRALLILAVWYSKLFHTSWWMARRARIECRAICRYLGRLTVRNQAFEEVLEVVRIACVRFDSQATLTLLGEPGAFSQLIQRNRKQSLIPNAPTSKKVDMFWMSP